MDIRKVKKLIELLEESGVAEIEIHEGEESVRISRNSTSAPVMTMAAPAPLAAAPLHAAPAAPAPAAAPAGCLEQHRVADSVGKAYEALGNK